MSTAERIPNSVLKVKAWYDAGFLEPEQITSHDNAKKFITATMAYVNHLLDLQLVKLRRTQHTIN